jgi:OmpA-OmpF porin, OOP family
MMRSHYSLLAISALGVTLAFWAPLASSQSAKTPLADAAGTRDYVAIKRFKDSVLLAQSEVPFQTIELQLGPLKMVEAGRRATAAKVLSVSGRVLRSFYVAPSATSVEEVHANFIDAFGKSGFAVEYACRFRECGAVAHGRVYNNADKSLNREAVSGSAFAVGDSTFIAARGGTAARPIWALVMVDTYRRSQHPADGRPAILQVVIEERAATLGLVETDAAAIGEALAASGKVALYGIFFDTDSAVVKSESQPQLAEIAKFMQANLKSQVLVVGHTDSQGAFDYNLQLSGRRAEAVVKELTGKFGIAAARLKPHGAGMTAPVASNRDEAGRAKNRRVEIVER